MKTQISPRTVRWLMGSTLAAAVMTSGLAQEAKVEMEQRPLPELPKSISGTETVDQRMQAFLKTQQLRQGENEEGGRSILVWLGKGTISVPPSDKNFVLARNIAFQKAMLDVKQKCAEFMETRVSSEMMQDMSSPGAERAAADAMRLQREGLAQEGAVQVAKALNSDVKVRNAPATLQTAGLYGEKILENKMKEELAKKGIDPNKPVDQQQVKAILNTSSFKNKTRATARARCTGIKVMASFEQNPASGQGQIGVVTVWTRKLHEIADAVITGNYTLIPRGEPGIAITQHIPQDERTLVSTYGTQMVRNEKGEYVLLAFAQAQPQSKSQQSKDLAYKMARLQAQGMIRSFLGEAISSTNDMLQREESTEFEDESNEVKIDSANSNKVQAIAEKLPIKGMQEAHQWETLHPANNGPVVGVVMEWKAASAQLAGMLRGLNQASGAKTAEAVNRMNAGGGSVGGATPAGGGSGAAQSAPRTSNANSGQGVKSRDF
ncbi:DUF6844 domain-containing protein [Limnohabitans sp.]|uniref:DUF6844 domain-containing protein n=1 Tax=Limnohabitans sp. TaxID=1907725 RepID=UPI0025C2D574|nr:hypothetical protein [Limnohabitans sp.]